MSARIAVGTALPPLVLPPISRTTLALFAGASGDTNPIHVDLDVARSAGLDDVFAHGMLSMAYLGRLLTGWAPGGRLRSWRVRFTAITPVLSSPRCEGVVTAVDDGVATVEVSVRLEDGTTTLRGTALVDLT
ncbi:MAG TPA: MaoC/PaaZ C-terminal domain-containing protein [Umezawaea sp.]|nr:MaoC/PaaZ C-terminal domain-containing protein [Umezawaea sp.]